MELAQIDGNISENQLQRYEHLVKHYDRQLLHQLKNRDYDVHKIHLEEEESDKDGNENGYNMDQSGTDTETTEMSKNDESVDKSHKIAETKENDTEMNNAKCDEKGTTLQDRIFKIEAMGYTRNRLHFEFLDNKNDYEKAKTLFYKELSLALQDGLISKIEEEMHIRSMKIIEAEYDDELAKNKINLHTNQGEHYDCIGDAPAKQVYRGYSDRGRQSGRRYGDRGYNARGFNGRGFNGRGFNGRGFNGRGFNGRGFYGRGFNGRGRNTYHPY